MLLTVFADRLLGSEQLSSSTEHGEHLALAVQFLDYPLLLLQSGSASSAGTVQFRTGKAAAVDADDREVDFLLSHVPTTVLLLGISNQSQPRLLATGRLDLPSPSSRSIADTRTVHKQNVVLRDAAEQPVACAELYASLQPGNSIQSQWTQLATYAPAADAAPRGCVKATNLQYDSGLQGQQQSDLQPIAMQPPPAPATTQQWPADIQLQGQLHPAYHVPSAAVLEHRRIVNANSSDATADCTAMGHRAHSGKENIHSSSKSADTRVGPSNNRAGSPRKGKRQAADKDTVKAAALRASQILTGRTGAKAAVAVKPAAARPTQQQYQGYVLKEPDVWSPPPPRPYWKHLGQAGRGAWPVSSHKKVSPGPRQTAQQQPQLKGMQQLKRQQMQHWHDSMQQQQQPRSHHEQQQLGRAASDDTTSDDCIELDDISCSLSAVLDSECDSIEQRGKVLVYRGSAETAAEAVGGVGGLPAGPNDAVHNLHSRKGVQILVQPSLPADWQLPRSQPPASAHQQQQLQQCSPAAQVLNHQVQPEQQQQVPAPVTLQTAASGCHNCAATLSAAAQLLQATQQAAAAANAQTSSTGHPSMLGVTAARGGVSAATSVVWEMMTLMILRAVMSQAVNSMANQVSSTVGQVLQQAFGGIGHLAVNAAAAGGALGSTVVPAAPWAWQQPPQPAAAAGAAAARDSRGGVQSAGTIEQQARQTAASAVPAAAQAEEQLTPQQLRQQQDELHRQFEQLEALMVIRDDSSADGSSSTGSTGRSRRSSRDRSADGSGSRSLDGQAAVRAMRKTGSLPQAWSTEGADPATAAGMVVRLRRTISGRRDGPGLNLSRSASAAGDRWPRAASNVADSKGVTSAAAAGDGISSKQQRAAADAGWLTLEAAAPVSEAVGAGTKAAAAVPARRSSSGVVTLPPLVRGASLEGAWAAAEKAAAGEGGGFGSPLNMRRKLSAASVDTTYSGNYEEDFELPDSPQPTSPKNLNPTLAKADGTTAATSTAAQAAAAALDMLHRALPAVTATSPTPSTAGSRQQQQQQQQQGYSGPVRRGSGSGGIGSNSWQRSSLKLDRRGSELPEIPEIPEESVDSLDGDLQDLGIESSTSVFRPQQQQQQEGMSTFGNRAAGGSTAAAANRSSRRTSRVLDSLDTLTESIMEEMLPPAANTLSRRGSRELHTVTESQDWPAATAAAGARTMAAAMPANVGRAVTAAASTAVRSGPGATARSATTGSSSADASQQQQQPAARQLNTVSSFMSVDSALDDLLASSDFAMPVTAGTAPADISDESATEPTPARQTSIAADRQTLAQGAPSSSTATTASLQAAQQQQSKDSRGLGRVSSAAHRGLSNYDDVSFLSDEDEDPPTAVVVLKQQEGRPTKQQGGLDSGASFMSSLDGSDLDIEYSAMSAGGAAEPSYKPSSSTVIPAARAVSRGAAAATASSRQTAGSTASSSSSKGGQKGTAARNAADVFYSHVSGTPSYLTGAVVGGRGW